ncbi:MAG: gliding motility-associated C-terminal domain-containing protein [Chitinophagales bacterium]|nr:gliding motility-associated C-terminal domain-containing protein [Chitinophagales bacterium]
MKMGNAFCNSKWGLFALLFLFLTHFSNDTYAQIGCFKIKSILVDACGLPEADNEMVRFQVGNTPLNVSSLNVTWSTTSNAFLGICQNAATASVVNAINSTITSCGYVREPVGNILPANSQVILTTSTALNPTANSFANLQDTIYMIFQCPGNTSGHFKNYASGAGPRNFSMTFGTGCTETVTYVVDSLIDATGAHVTADGAAVQFDNLHNASYFNDGCNAPIVPLVYSASLSNNTVCAGIPITASAQITSGNYNSIYWHGGSGTFNNTTVLNTLYTPASNFQGNDQLYFSIINACHDTITDTLNLSVTSSGLVSITASGPTTFCIGGNVTLTAQGTGSFVWSNGSSSPAITVSTAGVYTITLTSTCGSTTASQTVSVISNPTTLITASGPTTFCEGDSVTLTASGASSYLWSNGSSNSTINVLQTGAYTVTGNSSCGNSQATQNVVVNPLPLVTITTADSSLICQGSSLTVNATGNSPLLWSNGSSNSNITINTQGIYTITATNSCGSAYDSIYVFVDSLPQVSITSSNGSSFCIGDSAFLIAHLVGIGNLTWQNGSNNDSLLVITDGNYTVTATNNCGTTNSSYSIITSPAPSVSISPGGPINLCEGDTITLLASGNYTNALWSDGSTNDSLRISTGGVIHLSGFNNCGVDSDSVIVNYTLKPTIAISTIGNLSICQGDTTRLIASGIGNLVWSTGSTNDTILVTSPGNYTAITTNTCGSTSLNVIITGGLIPTVLIDGSDGILCKGESEILQVYSNDNILWSTGDTTNTIEVNTPGQYFVTATNSCGSATNSIVIDTSNVQAYFIPSTKEGFAPLAITVDNLSVNAVQSIWSFETNSIKYLFEPTHTFESPNTYFVNLTVIDQYGCSDEYIDTIIVRDVYYYIPNAFSPNNDNKNEVFTISSNDVNVFDATIYNRWGQAIYSWNQNTIGWSGLDSNNKECKEDVYYYVFNLALSNDTKTIYGKVNLIR